MIRRLIVVSLLLAACGPSPEPAAPGAVPIENFHEVAPGVYRGAQPDAAGFAALRGLGVKTIVDLRARHDDAPAVDLGFDVVRIPMTSFPQIPAPSDEDVKRFLDVVTDLARRPVFVHCAVGKDRTGTMCALYRMEIDGWAPARAFAEMQSFGYHEAMYAGLGEFVRGYKPRGLAKPTSR